MGELSIRAYRCISDYERLLGKRRRHTSSQGYDGSGHFVKKFLDILKRHSDYLVVSGYVSICSGRARGTEDVDILFPVMSREKFEMLFKDLTNNGFWCYQGDDHAGVHRYVKDMDSVRFALKKEMFPNIELIPIDESRKAQHFEFSRPQKIRINDFEFKVPEIEFEIAYKETVLGSEKDMEDAMHLRVFFSSGIDEDKLKKYKSMLRRGL